MDFGVRREQKPRLTPTGREKRREQTPEKLERRHREMHMYVQVILFRKAPGQLDPTWAPLPGHTPRPGSAHQQEGLLVGAWRYSLPPDLLSQKATRGKVGWGVGRKAGVKGG